MPNLFEHLLKEKQQLGTLLCFSIQMVLWDFFFLKAVHSTPNQKRTWYLNTQLKDFFKKKSWAIGEGSLDSFLHSERCLQQTLVFCRDYLVMAPQNLDTQDDIECSQPQLQAGQLGDNNKWLSLRMGSYRFRGEGSGCYHTCLIPWIFPTVALEESMSLNANAPVLLMKRNFYQARTPNLIWPDTNNRKQPYSQARGSCKSKTNGCVECLGGQTKCVGG